MSENNNNETAELFATRRKRLQEEEAQKNAQKAEEERLAELERQKQEVAEEIKRLESLQEKQKELEEKQRLAEEQRAQKEREEREAQEAKKAREAEAIRKEREEKAAKKEAARKEAKESKEEKKNKTDDSGLKKKLPYILIGFSAVLVIVAVIIIISVINKKKVSDFLSIDKDTGLLKIDTTMFGLSYNEFKDKIGVDELMKPEEWPWWGKNMEVVHVEDGGESFACLFQNNHLVQVYRDAETEKPGKAYDAAVSEYGKPSKENEYWSGYPQYEWKLTDCYYYQHVEIYEEKGHYRQQYVSFDYKE